MAAETATVRWHRGDPEGVAVPIARRVPYLELKLEHPALEPSGYGDQFFPDAVPYELDGEQRVFYWRSALAPSSASAADWRLACATTEDLVGADELPVSAPPLTDSDAGGATVTVDGTVAGDATTARVRSYAPPSIEIESVTDAAVELTVEGIAHSVERGDRRRIALDERPVEPVDAAGGERRVTPELVARYPGRRRIHHPPQDSDALLFPSFGLDLDAVAKPLNVPTAAGELDDAALATALGVDLAARPYPERVLWQAMAYTAFDPHAEGVAELAQLDSGHLVVRSGGADGGAEGGADRGADDGADLGAEHGAD